MNIKVFFCFLLSLFSSILLFCFSLFSYKNAIFNFYDDKDSAYEIALDFVSAFQENCENAVDTPESILLFSNNGCECEFELCDASSMLNLRTFPLGLSKYLCENADFDFPTTEYGFFNSSFPTNEKNLQNFPYVNKMPLLNIYFCQENLLSKIMQFYRISQKCEKMFFEELSNRKILNAKQLQKILGVKENSEILQIFGVKTTFWKLKFRYKNFIAHAIIVALPNSNSTENTVSRYVLGDFYVEKI